jgi:tryptophan synthase alpha chain
MSKTRLGHATATNNHLFIPFIMAGDPTPELTIELGLLMETSGADILELGIPYSDPLADGPVIQAAAIRALEQGMNLEKAMGLVSEMRKKGLTIPVIIFTYYNPVLQLGEEKLFKLMHEHQIDGILIPDLPFEESQSLTKRCDEEKLPLISLVAPTSKERIKKIAENAKGFLYCVSSLGVTGVRKEIDPQIHGFLQEVKKYSNVPIAVGFGISNRDQVEKLKPHCDGVIVGSALVKMIESKKTEMLDKEKKESAFLEIKEFVNSLISS